MDSLRGQFDSTDPYEGSSDDDLLDQDSTPEPPPGPIGQDERRMQVRAYNLWASLLGDRNYPTIDELEPDTIQDFGPYSVVLDFADGVENPAIKFLGAELAQECDAETSIARLNDVPSRSLLSRITDHYMQILANKAPIGFEAEFVNQREATILYRGILLPFSCDNATIDCIYGVINWKEIASPAITDALMAEISEELADSSIGQNSRTADSKPKAKATKAKKKSQLPLPSDALRLVNSWADGPGARYDSRECDADSEHDTNNDHPSANTAASLKGTARSAGRVNICHLSPAEAQDDWEDEDDGYGSLLPTNVKRTANVVAECESFDNAAPTEPASLYDWLAAAREQALAARNSEDRSRNTLYEAVGTAYDFSIAALADPDQFAELIAENSLSVQSRAPMTPIVKLVFGANYDKTRLTEYAAVLSYGHRMNIACGAMAEQLRLADGGLKGIVKEERRYRRHETAKLRGKVAPKAKRGIASALAKKLRRLNYIPLNALAGEGAEFGVVIIRRMPDGELAVLGDLSDNAALTERAAKALLV